MNTGLLILRLAVGLTLASHGGQKLFGWFGGGGIGGTAPFMEQLGFRPARLHAFLAGFSELVAGLFLAVGLLTPVASAIAVGVMFSAAVSVHLRSGFFAPKGGYEYVFILGASALAVAFTGPGAFSIDQVIGLSWSGEFWGLAALVVGLVAGGISLLSRHVAPQQASAPATRS
jgi:putative oxidoreductase